MIEVTLDVMLAKRKVKARDMAAAIGIDEANISKLRTGNVTSIRFSTLEKICAYLDCQPGDLLVFRRDAKAGAVGDAAE